jgi:hypothetical protein
MMDKLTRKMELLAYTSIVIMALVTTAVLVKKYFLSNSISPRDTRVPIGAKVSLEGEDWQRMV